MNNKSKQYLNDRRVEMDETQQELPKKEIPFENLHLASGLVNGQNKLWMYVFTILLFIFGYFAYQVIILYPLTNRLMERGYTIEEIQVNTSLLFDSDALGMNPNYVFALELGMFVFAFGGLYVGVKNIHHKTFTSILTGYENFRYKRTLFAFAVWSAFLVLATVAELFINKDNFELNINPLGLLVSVLIGLVLIPIQSGFEEILFRGYLMQGLSQVYKNGIMALITTSLLFGMLHMGNPEVKEYGWPIMLAYFCSTGLFFGMLTLLDEGIELAMGVHIANNLVSCILVNDKHSVIKSYSVLQRDKIDPYLEMLFWLVMAGLSFLIFKKKYGLKNFKLLLN
ncbi:MAG: CPBP family intramembrane metalloprotease [Bacteroidia bacterium]|nr:CPBP family intramembrane metalloprotease [Bacteroidia bacterium]